MSTMTLTGTQHAMLAHAIHHAEGRIDWFPENIKGGARQKVLQGLFNRALITPHAQCMRAGSVSRFSAAQVYALTRSQRPHRHILQCTNSCTGWRQGVRLFRSITVRTRGHR